MPLRKFPPLCYFNNSSLFLQVVGRTRGRESSDSGFFWGGGCLQSFCNPPFLAEKLGFLGAPKPFPVSFFFLRGNLKIKLNHQVS